MEMREFKIGRQFLLALFLIGIVMLISSIWFVFEFESVGVDIFNILHFGFALLPISISVYLYLYVRLFVSENGIRLEANFLNWMNYELTWEEIESVLIFTNPLNKQAQFFLYSSKLKMLKGLNPVLFEPVEGGQFSKPLTLKERILGSKKTTVLEGLIRQYAQNIKPVKQSELRSMLKDTSDDLGKEAAFFATLSLLAFGLGIAFLFLGDSKHLLSQNAYFWIGLVTILTSLIAIKVLPKDKKLAVFFITPLFAGCCAWLFVQSIHLINLKNTEAKDIEYRLVESQNVYQVWQASGYPEIEIHSDPGNLAYEDEGRVQIIKLHIGPIGFYDIPREEVNALLKSKQSFY